MVVDEVIFIGFVNCRSPPKGPPKREQNCVLGMIVARSGFFGFFMIDPGICDRLAGPPKRKHYFIVGCVLFFVCSSAPPNGEKNVSGTFRMFEMPEEPAIRIVTPAAIRRSPFGINGEKGE